MTSVQGEWSEENKTRRLTISQYVTDQLAIAVDRGLIEAIDASRVVERIMAEERFVSTPSREAIRRMLGTIPNLRTITRDETGREIPADLNRDAALSAIMRSNEPMSM